MRTISPPSLRYAELLLGIRGRAAVTGIAFCLFFILRRFAIRWFAAVAKQFAYWMCVNYRESYNMFTVNGSAHALIQLRA